MSTKAKITSGSQVDADLGGSGAVFTVSGATIINAQASPDGAWADIDLSGTVGANVALVALGIYATGDMDATAVRMNGDAYEYYDAAADATAFGVALGHHESGAGAGMVLMCVTDTAGVIEWITEASQTATIKLIAYIK